MLPLTAHPLGYDRGRVRAGIAHLGVGNFHRAHQAVYVDRCLHLPGQEGWGVCGIGVIDDPRERAKAAALKRQDGLYTLTACKPAGSPEVQVIGALVDYLHAPDDPAAAVARLCDPAIRIVSMTVTEGGYNLDEASGAFRLDAPGVVHDLAHPEAPCGVFGLIAAALLRRRAAGTGAFTVLSCDNLRHNGGVARKAVLAFAAAAEAAWPGAAGLADWIDATVTFPSGMVDRITPAVGPGDVARLTAASGIADEAPVFCEDFIQWVLEDSFCAGRPDFGRVGVQMTADVAPYEAVKLRMLNASHSLLAYPAILAGIATVHEAMAVPALAGLLRRFLDQDVIPDLAPPPGMALDAYRDAVLARFSNPAIGDQIPRIASDGAAKLPIFLGATARAAIAAGRPRRLAFLAAAFVRYVAGSGDGGRTLAVSEPHLSPAERALASAPDPTAALALPAFAGWGLDTAPEFVAAYRDFWHGIGRHGVMATVAEAS